MSYKALYRTYRPQTFKEVVGQDVVVKTLQNAIANNKISHAYLFAGPRGTGKTTIARLFAKALNCSNLEVNEPCNKCVSCQEISESSSPDVIEIDAASNNGVDEIREIRDKVKFLPVGAKHKIYIIDEVHMLSTGAFNALLKTLEEPPLHVIFILATTEVQKLPTTIISRCQRFDFKSLSVKEIKEKLKSIGSEENIEISDEALNAIAEAAEGGMRDALTILDQAISYADGEVTIEEVNLVTGNLSYDKLIELGECINAKNINQSLEIIDDLITMGKDVSKLVNNLTQFYRDMLLFQNVSSPMYTKYIFAKEKFKELCENTPLNYIFYCLDLLSDVQVKIKYSPTPRIYLETAIIKMINMANDELNIVKRVNELESRLENINIGDVTLEADNEKLNVLEVKLNRVISELSKLELHQLTERVENLESHQVPTTLEVNPEIYSKLNKIEESLLILNTTYNNLKNQFDNINKGEHVDNNIDEQVEKTETVDTQTIKNMQMDLDSLKLQLVKVENTQFAINDKVIDEINNRIASLEKHVYNLVSSDLANKEASKKPKTNNKQIGLFDEEVTTLDKEKVNVDFKDLSIDEAQKETKEDVTEAEPKTISEPEKLSEDNQSLFANERKLVEEMRPNITFTSKVTMNQDVVDVKVNNSEPVNQVNRFATYDCKIVERILHESRTEAARNDAKRINQLWLYLNRGVEPELLGIVETLRTGKIVAVGNKEFIIVFPTSILCNQVMRTSFKNDALKILYKQLGDTYNYMALPEHVWIDKRTEYVNQYNIGIKYPKLTPITDEELMIIKADNEYKDPKEEVINQIKETFGDDIVKIK